ncbi:transient receptor potential cation channel subfamily M member 2 isoform X3 [Trachypithecus francoisi]|uniref:transient receptor potential cation channel subfamily M member 2 isoform X3 n=1 Tax=Trachypithecus francoisi TaxID=54180 RepID=UPI00141B5159|nr:transient receptor potential cation channel subfamily M member 2 isoform X3 [Trachypithecus francoisi]
MEPSALRKAGSEQEEGFVGPPRRVADLGMVSNLWRSNSSLFKGWRPQCPFGNDKQESLSSWIPENIKKKECMYFVESSKLSDAGKVVCQCGYTRERHLEEATKPDTSQGTQWDPKKHVHEMPTDAFGDVVFTGLSREVKKYVRVSQDTPSSTIYHLMTQHWGLDVPNLLISVTGGAKNFNMKPRLKSIFRRGLVKVAQTTGAWVITGGSHAGVMKQVGEAVRDFSLSSSYKEGEVITIGVATWGTVHRREGLIHPTGSFPAEYILDEDGQGNLTCLDSNHSHFILVDDGTHGQYGVEIPLRTRLEKFISEQTKERGGVAIKIPIVCVVLEGGPGTLQTIYNATTNGTPCVVVEGSGRVADVIAQVANLPVSDITVSLIQQKLSVFFQEMFETFTESRIVEWTKKIQDIVRRRQLLTVFREGKDGQQDVDVAILQALLKASRSQDHFGHENWDHQLKLAVAWNRVDIARSEIFTDEWQWKPSDLHPMMTAALISNKPEFVKLFLENGVQLKEFVTWDTLLYLYENLEPSCLFHSKLQKVLAEEPERLACTPAAPRLQMHHVAQVLRELLGDFTQPLYPWPQHSDRPRLLLPVPHIKLNVQGVSLRSLYKRSSGHVTFTMDPVRDLLIWAIVQNRRELAGIIWAQSQDCIAGALACSKILKELSKEEEDTDSSEEMLALAEECEHRAIGVFTECYRKDEERAQKLLIRVSEAWGKTTCLQLALEAKDMKFVSHGGVQAFLTKVWWGQLCVDNGLWRVTLCMLAFPLLLTGLISFREKRLQEVSSPVARARAFFTAPVVVFHLNILSYFAFLCLFAYVLMVDFQPTPSWCECAIYLWLFSLVCEETRQLFYDPDECGLMKKAALYFSDFWNKLDVGAILLFVAGLTCSYTFQQVQEHTDQIWKFQRHDLIEEYHSRPAAPPPFILLSHLQLFIKRVILKTPAKRHKQLKNKLEKNEEAALLSWEIYLKENYLQNQQFQQKQRPEQKIEDISNKVDAMVDLLDLDPLKRSGSMEQRLASLEEQVAQTARALHWIVKTLRAGGFGSEVDVPTLASQKAMEEPDTELGGGKKMEEPGDSYHVNARHLLYPNCPITRFPVPNEKVPWETEFLIYDPPFYTAERKDTAVTDPVGDTLEPLSTIQYNMVDGLWDRRSFHGPYAVQAGFPMNPMGRTGLRGRGSLSCFGPNHTLYPMVTRWRRNEDGAICRKSIKKMLEVLVVKLPLSEHWALPGGSREPGETLPQKLKRILRQEHWLSFENLLARSTEVYKGYMDDPRNTDNAWIETVAVSIHFQDHNDAELNRLNSSLHVCDSGASIRWQVVDRRIPLYANHKTLLQKVAAEFGAHY